MPSVEQIEAMDTMAELREALEAQGDSGKARSKQVLRGRPAQDTHPHPHPRPRPHQKLRERLLSLLAVRDTVRRQDGELSQAQGALGG